MKNPITIWLIEDNSTFRSVVARLLNDTPGLSCPVALSSAEAALRRLGQDATPEVILLDVALPGLDGLSAIRQFKARAPHARIVMLTVYDDQEKIRRAIGAGASGYLLKTSSEEEIAAAIRAVMAGRAPMNQEVAASVWQLLAEMTGPRDDYGLTPREREILHGAAEGLVLKEIADRLGMSPHTADTHLRHIYHKLGVNSRAAAVAKALQQRLV